jgi:hypothetical protein
VIRRSVRSRDRLTRWDADHMGRGLQTAQIMLIICYQIKLDKLSILRLLLAISTKCVVDFAQGFGSNPLDICIFPSLHCR